MIQKALRCLSGYHARLNPAANDKCRFVLPFVLCLLFLIPFIAISSWDGGRQDYETNIRASAASGLAGNTVLSSIQQQATEASNTIRSNFSQFLQRLLTSLNSLHKLQLTLLQVCLVLLLVWMFVQAYFLRVDSDLFYFQIVLKNSLPVRAGPLCRG